MKLTSFQLSTGRSRPRVRHCSSSIRGGFTLLELSIVIGILLALLSAGLFVSGGVEEWRAGRRAAETLRGVHVAQRTFLADHPTTPLSSVSREQLRPYLPDHPAEFPTIEGLDGKKRAIDVSAAPPVVLEGSDSVYDPSGRPNDSLWDVGEARLQE